MNTAQLSGIAKNIVGRFQERTGKFLGNKEQQMTGMQKQRMGNAEKNLGDARELIKNAVKQMQKSKRAMHLHTATTYYLKTEAKTTHPRHAAV